MLKIEHISTGYGKKQVLFDISFDVHNGEILLLAGSNGSGKSTLLKAIYGILPQWNKGQIIFNSENITGKPAATLLKKGLLYVPQQTNLFEDLTIKENLEMAGLTLEKNLMKQRIENVISIFSLLSLNLNRIPMKLSGGERRLLAISMALMHQPKMILLDEPLSGLSAKNINFIMSNLKILNEKAGITFLLVEHRIKECLDFSNRIIGLKQGKVFSETLVNARFKMNELNSLFI